jgi:hypothetical protein
VIKNGLCAGNCVSGVVLGSIENRGRINSVGRELSKLDNCTQTNRQIYEDY